MPPRAPQRQQFPSPAARRAALLVAVSYGCLAGFVAAGWYEVGRVLLGNNVHAIVPGRVYRGAQPSGPELEHIIRRHGIRTVINLRGSCPGMPWYDEEGATTCRLDVAQEDICFSALRLPAVWELRRLVEVFDRCEYPIFIHCRRGADRTGLASAVYLLLNSPDLPGARRQLRPRYGHISLGGPAQMNRFLDLYEEWLAGQGLRHSPREFRRWIAEGYFAGECWATVEPLAWPTELPRDTPTALQVRVHNRSPHAWRLRPGTCAGVHLVYALGTPDSRFQLRERVGFFDAVVPPGESLELTLVLPALKMPGSYFLIADLSNPEHCAFFQAGSEPLFWRFEVK